VTLTTVFQEPFAVANFISTSEYVIIMQAEIQVTDPFSKVWWQSIKTAHDQLHSAFVHGWCFMYLHTLFTHKYMMQLQDLFFQRPIHVLRESTSGLLDDIMREVQTAYPLEPNRLKLVRGLGQKELAWAQHHLVKPDRVQWFMDYFKNFVMRIKDPTDIALIYEYIDTNVKNQLLNFLSLPIPAIQNATWTMGEDILSRFERYEQEWRSEQRGDLRYLWSEKVEPMAVDHWPMDAHGIARIEQRILQNPNWLAYWERFDWTSWQWLTCRYWYDKHNQKVAFYEVPCIAYHNSAVVPDRTSVTYDLKSQSWDPAHGLTRHYNGQLTQVIMPSAIHLIKSWIKKNLTGQNLEYLNGRYYVRFGRWREDERSKNWLASKIEGQDVWELGVSAYHADWDIDEQRWNIADGINYDTINGTMNSLISDPNKQIYLIQGRELPTDGEDGEPLLKDVKLVKVLDVKDICFPGVFDPRQDELRESK